MFRSLAQPTVDARLAVLPGTIRQSCAGLAGPFPHAEAHGLGPGLRFLLGPIVGLAVGQDGVEWSSSAVSPMLMDLMTVLVSRRP